MTIIPNSFRMRPAKVSIFNQISEKMPNRVEGEDQREMPPTTKVLNKTFGPIPVSEATGQLSQHKRERRTRHTNTHAFTPVESLLTRNTPSQIIQQDPASTLARLKCYGNSINKEQKKGVGAVPSLQDSNFFSKFNR